MKSKIILFTAFAILWLLGGTLLALDLRFTSAIRMTPASPAPGNTITFTVSFTPQDGVVTNFKITGGVDATKVYERDFASIPANATRTVSFTWTSVAGNHTAWFVLDPDHLMGDDNYGNNRVELAFSGGVLLEAMQPVITMQPAVFKPDLIISNYKFTKDTSRDDKYFYQITFKNQGGGCVGMFNFKLYSIDSYTGADLCASASCLKGTIAAVAPLCALKAGQEKTIYGFILKSDFNNCIKFPCSEYDAPGPQKFKYYNPWLLWVDCDNNVEESNEGNNKTARWGHNLEWENECEE